MQHFMSLFALFIIVSIMLFFSLDTLLALSSVLLAAFYCIQLFCLYISLIFFSLISLWLCFSYLLCLFSPPLYLPLFSFQFSLSLHIFPTSVSLVLLCAYRQHCLWSSLKLTTLSTTAHLGAQSSEFCQSQAASEKVFSYFSAVSLP